MILYTKKWWLLGCHRRAERRYSVRGSNDGTPVLIAQAQFIKGDSEVLGLAHKQCVFARFRPSRFFKFWEKEYNEEKLKIRINDYWDIYEACRDEGYISLHRDTGYPTVSNSKAYKIRGFPLGYFWGLISDYDKVWVAVGALIVALIGLVGSFFTGIFVGKDTEQTPQEQAPIVIYLNDERKEEVSTSTPQSYREAARATSTENAGTEENR